MTDANEALDIVSWIDAEITKINDAKWGAIESHDDSGLRMLNTFSEKLLYLRAHLTDSGYVRVPVEPTAKIIKAMQKIVIDAGDGYISMTYMYRAMLAAATKETSHD